MKYIHLLANQMLVIRIISYCILLMEKHFLLKLHQKLSIDTR